MERFLLDHKVFPSMEGALKRAKINRIEKNWKVVIKGEKTDYSNTYLK